MKHCDVQPIDSCEVEEWRGYVGRTERREQILDIESLRRFAAAVGSDLDVKRNPPPLGHWAYFLEAVASHEIGDDGHPLRNRGLLPPIRLPRRMFASSMIQFRSPMVLGEPAELTLRVSGVKHRVNETGDLVFVDLDRNLSQNDITRAIERQTIVYRSAGNRVPAIQPVAFSASDGEDTWLPTSVDLFRFSAATFNSHRIHYDLSYARSEEGYPNVVVHGPFTAAKLFAYAQRRALATSAISGFAFRATAPLFVGQPIRLRPGENANEVQAVRCDGSVAMTAQVQLGEEQAV